MERKFLIGMFIFLFFPVIYATEEEDYIDNFDFANVAIRGDYEGTQIVAGILKLKDGMVRGTFTSDTIPTKTDFNGITIFFLADIPEGSVLQVEFSAVDRKGVCGPWLPVKAAEYDIRFSNYHRAYRYRITLEASSQGVSPCFRKIGFFYGQILEDMMSLEDKPWQKITTRAVPKPSIVSRAEWCARKPNGSYTSHTPVKITIHHTYRPTASQYKGSESIRQIQNYHMDTNGWMDIGYHFLIGTYPSSGDTKIYQGRPEDVVGAHTAGANTNNVGVNVIGDYTTEALHSNSYKNLIRLLGWLCDHYRINPDAIHGHCDFNSTACPGNNLYRLKAQIRKDVRDYINGGGGGDTGQLIGIIYDAAQGTSVKISGAVVTLNTGQSVTTGSDGVYSFHLPSGTYNIKVVKTGYQTGYATETVTANQTIWESVGLKK